MPRVGGLLTESERAAFAPWLRSKIESSGLSKKSLAKTLGSESTARINRYVRTELPELPTPLVLLRLCQDIALPWPIAFVRAGYFREVLGAVAAMATISNEYFLKGESVQFSFADLTGSEFRREVLQFALCAFPRRDVAADRGVEAYLHAGVVAEVLQELPLETKAVVRNMTRGLHGLLARAADVLADRALPPEYRRAIAGEYVSAWADAFDFSLAQEIRASLRVAEEFVDVFKTLTNKGEETDGSL